MNRIITILLALFCFAVFCPNQSYAFFENHIKKAEELIDAGYVNIGREELQKAIKKDPLDPDINYRAGFLFLKLNSYSNAMISFQNVKKYNGSHKQLKKISEALGDIAFLMLEKGHTNSAEKMFKNSFAFDLTAIPDTAKQLTQTIEDYISKGIACCPDNARKRSRYFKKAYLYAKTTTDLFPKMNKSVADIYYDSFYNHELIFFEFSDRAIEFDPGMKKTVIKKLLSIHKNTRASKETKKMAKRYIKRYSGKKEFLNYFPPPPPDKRIDTAGEYFYNLKAGETTNYWIKIDIGRKMKYGFFSDNWRFEIIFDDGQIAKAWKIKKWPSKKIVKCKIHAITDQNIKLVVK